MKFLSKVTLLGHPYIKYGEKYNNIIIRQNFLNFLFFFDSNRKKPGLVQEKNYSTKKKIETLISHSYFSKIELRKKKYQLNRKIKETILSYRALENCSIYFKFKSQNVHKKPIVLYGSNPKNYQLIQEINGEKTLFGFQSGAAGLFSIEAPNKILLDDIKTRKITFILNSSLSDVRLLSPHPDFHFSFIASNKKCSEFWRLSKFHRKTSINYIFHKDPVIFQKYRPRTKLLDLCTLNRKWKCFDEMVQKYTFFHQFNEYILDVSTHPDNNLTAVSTVNHLYLFDNRIGKKISSLKINTTQYESIEWARKGSDMIIFAEKSFILNQWFEQNVVKNRLKLDYRDKFNLYFDLGLILVKQKKKPLEILGMNNRNFRQIIDLKEDINGVRFNENGSLLAVKYIKKIKLFQLR